MYFSHILSWAIRQTSGKLLKRMNAQSWHWCMAIDAPFSGDIVTLLCFRPSVCASVRLYVDLVNTIETTPLCTFSSNLADMFTMMR